VKRQQTLACFYLPETGNGDLQATTRYVKVLDEEDPKAAEVMSAMLGDVA
jgi:ubiquinone biosynthesis protein UbiJ